MTGFINSPVPCARNPVSELELPRPEKRLPQEVLTLTEVERLLAIPNVNDPLGIRDRTMLELFYSTLLNPKPDERMLNRLSITLEQIVEETRHWPPEKVGELVGRLTEDLHSTDPETEAAGKTEIDRRVEEIQTGKVQGIPAEEVFEKAKPILGR